MIASGHWCGERIADGRILTLIESFLKQGIMNTMAGIDLEEHDEGEPQVVCHLPASVLEKVAVCLATLGCRFIRPKSKKKLRGAIKPFTRRANGRSLEASAVVLRPKLQGIFNWSI